MKNEPAFPSTLQYFPDDTSYHDNEGMTLRDYFAAKAMQALVRHNYFDITASQAYQMADAMMAERNKP